MADPSPSKKRRSDGATDVVMQATDATMEQVIAVVDDPRKQSLPDVPFSLPFEGGDSFYVRECYKEYYPMVESILANGRKDCCVTLTGTPGELPLINLSLGGGVQWVLTNGHNGGGAGIGKSVFYAYFLDRYLSAHSDTWIIATSYSNEELTEVAVFRKKDEKTIHLRGMDTAIDDAVEEAGKAEQEQAGKKVLFLCDGPPKRTRKDGQMVVFTSPNERWLQKVVRKRSCTYYMPLWTLEELQDAAQVLGLPLSEDEIEKRFDTFGGAARYCLHPKPTAVRQAAEDLMAVVAQMTKPDTVQQWLLATETSVTRHCILHYEPNEYLTGKRAILASSGVEAELAKQLENMKERDRRALRMSLRGIPEGGALRGWLFEAETHSALCQRRSLHLWPLGSDATAASAAVEEVDIELTEDRLVEFETVTPSMLRRGPYHKPRSKTFESIDGFYLSRLPVADGQSVTVANVAAWNQRNRLLLFQTTVSSTHSVNAAGMIHVINSLGLLKSVKEDPTRVALVFVVPKILLASFTRQTITAVATSGSDVVTKIPRIGKVTADVLKRVFGIQTVGELQTKMVLYERNQLSIPDDDRVTWGRAYRYGLRHGLVTTDLSSSENFSEVMASIPQYVCSWEPPVEDAE